MQATSVTMQSSASKCPDQAPCVPAKVPVTEGGGSSALDSIHSLHYCDGRCWLTDSAVPYRFTFWVKNICTPHNLIYPAGGPFSRKKCHLWVTETKKMASILNVIQNSVIILKSLQAGKNPKQKLETKTPSKSEFCYKQLDIVKIGANTLFQKSRENS